MGRKYADLIQKRYSANTQLQQHLIPFSTTSRGRDVLGAFYNTHAVIFPNYMDELRGLAEGANIPFDHVLLMNLRQEISYFVNSSSVINQVPVPDHCSDYMLHSDAESLVGHNEDGAKSDLDREVLVSATIGAGTHFKAYTYAGDLPTGGFGWNEHGVAFTLNFVPPTTGVLGGLGRGFVSRDVLESISLDDAINRATRKGQGAGHNLNLMDVHTGRIVNVEVCHDDFALKNVTTPAYFHANLYQNLNVSQGQSLSSVHRVARAKQMPSPTNASEILAVLGDQHDTQYPIFHNELSHQRGDLSDWTLISCLFDVGRRTVTIFEGNPKDEKVLETFPLL